METIAKTDSLTEFADWATRTLTDRGRNYRRYNRGLTEVTIEAKANQTGYYPKPAYDISMSFNAATTGDQQHALKAVARYSVSYDGSDVPESVQRDQLTNLKEIIEGSNPLIECITSDESLVLPIR